VVPGPALPLAHDVTMRQRCRLWLIAGLDRTVFSPTLPAEAATPKALACFKK